MPEDPRPISGGRAAVDSFFTGGSVADAMRAASVTEAGADITTPVGALLKSPISADPGVPTTGDPLASAMRERAFASAGEAKEFASSIEGRKHAETSRSLIAALSEHVGVESAFDNMDTTPVAPAPTSQSEAHEELNALKEGIGILEEKLDETDEVLRAHNITRAQAEQIIDCLCVRNIRYKEKIELLSGRVSVVFQTRLVSDADLLTEVIEARRPSYREAVNNERWRHLLAASIVRYAGETFGSNTADDYDKRLRWVNRLSEPLFNMLAVALEDFDMKTQAVLKPSFLRRF